MAFMPNKKQRNIVKLRNHAASLGLQVRLVDFSSLKKGITLGKMACYGLRWDVADMDKAKKIKAWQLIEGEMDHEIHFCGRWDWAKSELKADVFWQPALKNLFQTGKDDPVFNALKVLELNAQGVQVCWYEHAEIESVDKIAVLLGSLKSFALHQQTSLEWPSTL